MITDIKEGIKGEVRYSEPMDRHTSFRIGGPADIWIEPADLDDLKACIRISTDKRIPLLITGGGTNLLVRDEGVRGVVVSMRSPSSKNIRRDGRSVTVTSSVTLMEFMDFCVAEGLGGAEFLSGIPGTVGGAVATNAGARHYEAREKWQSIGGLVEEIKVMDYAYEERLRGKKELIFSYKTLGLADCVILEVKFLLTEAPREGILDEYRRFLGRKKATQELGAASAGCIFKNPPDTGRSAAELIDSCGLKGLTVGGAAVSKKHANFIINTGKARASDVTELMGVIKEKVKDKFGVQLTSEIKIV